MSTNEKFTESVNMPLSRGGVVQKSHTRTRNGFIDSYRFIASIIIMIYHSYHLYEVNDYPFNTGFIFVEAFFCLTGYFTVLDVERHKKRNTSLKATLKDSILYTIRKYSRFVPYTSICVFISLIIRHVVIHKDFEWLMVIRGIIESLMIIRGDSNVGVIWYLTALLPVVPFFYTICKVLNKRVVVLGSILICGAYYLVYREYPVFFPTHYIRAMAGFCTGIVCFYLSSWIKEKAYKYYCAGEVLLFFPVILCFLNIQLFFLDIGCFILGFGLVLANCAKNTSNGITEYLGRISLPLYLVSLNIADLINWYCINIGELSIPVQYILYFTVSAILSIVLEYIVCKIKKAATRVRNREKTLYGLKRS